MRLTPVGRDANSNTLVSEFKTQLCYKLYQSPLNISELNFLNCENEHHGLSVGLIAKF